MLNGILGTETELILQTVWQQFSDCISVCLRCSRDSKICSADIALKGTGSLVISNLPTNDINSSVFLYELWKQIFFSVRSYEMEPFNACTLEAVSKDIGVIVEFVYRNLTVIRVKVYRDTSDAMRMAFLTESWT